MTQGFDPRVLRRRLVAWSVAASAVTAVVITAYYQLVGRIDADRDRLDVIAQNVINAGVGLVIAAIVVNAWVKRRFEPEWVEVAGGDASTAVRERLLRQPARLGTLVFLLWLFPVVLAPLDDVFERSFRAAGAEVVGIFLGSLANAAALYLLTERQLRPLFDAAYRAGPRGSGRAPGVRQRFLVAWLLGSAVSLAGIAVTPLVRTGDIPPTVAMAYLAVAGLLVGWGMSRAMARSISDPLDEAVGVMAKVEAGDLDVPVAVNDTGDIGRVQAGLRAMVAGLRERRQLEDLFGRHVGTDVARQALARGIALGGEAQEATILFVDMVGSTATTAVSHPAEVVERANRFFAAVVETVDAAGGWLHKFQGDGAVAVFGVPLPDDGHVQCGAGAAATLHERLDAVGFDAAVGVATGTVVAGNVGTAERLEYTVMGAPVNLAARLCEAAKQQPGRVLMSGPADALAAAGWRQAGSFELRGFPQPTAAWAPPEPVRG